MSDLPNLTPEDRKRAMRHLQELERMVGPLDDAKWVQRMIEEDLSSRLGPDESLEQVKHEFRQNHLN